MTKMEEAARARKLAARTLMIAAYEDRFGGLGDELKQVYQPVYLDQDWNALLMRIDVADIMNSLDSGAS